MSIQRTKSRKKKHIIFNKTRLISVGFLLSAFFQALGRLFSCSNPKVYFRYYNPYRTHPTFIRFYKHPPLNWSTRYAAELLHWISSPDIIDQRPFVIEPNDHPLSPTRMSEPVDVLENQQKAIDIYLHSGCKKIFVESVGQMKLFQHYCPEEVIQKSTIIAALPTIPKDVDWKKRSGEIERPVFLCLASDYTSKGVDLLIQAWMETPERKDGELVIVCSEIPNGVTSKIKNENIKIVPKAPLTESEKDSLHRSAHIVIAPQHIDGGGNMFEAIEWGLPIITMRSQRHEGLLGNNNGFFADVPFYFYDYEFYGTRWKTFEEFFSVLKEEKQRGEFNTTVEELKQHIRHFFLNPDDIIKMGKKSYEYASGKLSLENRNAKLLSIYNEILYEK
jgi:glycosyltransferase involved in cell wall biosynthesis